MTDWISNPTLSAAEKLERFKALGPEPTHGPRVADQSPPCGVITKPSASSVLAQSSETTEFHSGAAVLPGAVSSKAFASSVA